MSTFLVLYKKVCNFIVFPVFVYFVWRSLIFIFQILFQGRIFSFDSTTQFQRLYLSWITLWDSGHYLEIAIKGYEYPNQAFFPLWPLVLKSLSLTGISIYKIDFFLSNFFCLIIFILFYNLGVKIIGRPAAQKALILLAVFPSSFYLISGYSESLFLIQALTFFCLLEAGRFKSASFVSALATATRFSGVGLSAALLVMNTRITRKLLLFAISILGLLSYLIYLKLYFGDPLLFVRGVWEWGRFHYWKSMVFPPITIFSAAYDLIKNRGGGLFRYCDFLFGLAFLALLPLVYKKLGKNYLVYSLILILIPLSSGKTESLIRYLLPVFPVFLIAGNLLSSIRPKLLFYIFAASSFIFQLYLLTRFINYLWVA
ncbi:MAG: hypothetical protein M1352_00250 [Patescibacteria group bacterium]|nr:hypothetical protein [Patescibacteria group bacterium]